MSKGDKGGFIEKEGNLELYGNSWVYGNAQVYDDARVYGELKLISGYFYHTKRKTESIEEVSLDNDYVILAKEPQIETEPKIESFSGKKVEVKIDGKTFIATID